MQKKQTKTSHPVSQKRWLWKIVIEGLTPSDVHGVMLRESVQKLAVSEIFVERIKGKVRNIKNTNRAEIIALATEKDVTEFEKTTLKALPEKNPLLESDDISSHGAEKITNRSLRKEIEKQTRPTFKIVREDELTEMTWALQSAGKTILVQEDVRAENLVRGVRVELNSNILLVKDIKTRRVKLGRRFRVLSVGAFLGQPPKKCNKMSRDDYNSFLYKLNNLYEACSAYNYLLRSGGSYYHPSMTVPLAEIESAIDEVKVALDKYK